MRTIGVVTVGRSDYGICLPVLRRIQEDLELRLHLIVAGMHLSPDFGLTVEAIEVDGFEIGERVEMLLPSDTPEAIAKSMGLGTLGYAQAYARLQPDILVVLGDRFEMHAAAVAALPFKIPVAHIHGGEITEGAIDDALRHSITKLSHLHFASTVEFAQRILQMGEEPWRVVVSGAPSLDNLRSMPLLDPGGIEKRFGLNLSPAPILVTYHPVTLEFEETEWQVREMLRALEESGAPLVFTMPNADTSGRVITCLLNDFVKKHHQAKMVNNMGTQGYFSLMANASAMVGNSSSGIIEAPSFALPVVNIGTRQEGRVKAANVIDVGYSCGDIFKGVKNALDPEFRTRLDGMANPYGDGHAAEVIVKHLREVSLTDCLIRKRFVAAPTPSRQQAKSRGAHDVN